MRVNGKFDPVGYSMENQEFTLPSKELLCHQTFNYCIVILLHCEYIHCLLHCHDILSEDNIFVLAKVMSFWLPRLLYLEKGLCGLWKNQEFRHEFLMTGKS